jgi:hypothetical protein
MTAERGGQMDGPSTRQELLVLCPPRPREQSSCLNYSTCCFRNFPNHRIWKFLFVAVHEDQGFYMIWGWGFTPPCPLEVEIGESSDD